MKNRKVVFYRKDGTQDEHEYSNADPFEVMVDGSWSAVRFYLNGIEVGTVMVPHLLENPEEGQESGINCDKCGSFVPDDEIYVGQGDTTICKKCHDLEQKHSNN